jgi:hypothetical protein
MTEKTTSPEVPPFRGTALAALLRSPLSLAARIAEDRSLWSAAMALLLWGLVFHAVYGFAMGLFGGMDVALMSAVKAPLIALCALLLCLPSLCVFSCVADMPISIAQTVALGASALAMTGLMLIGLAPVTWLFAVSTESLAFTVLLNLAIWGVCVLFTFRLFNRLSDFGETRHTHGIKSWLIVYIVVSLQMATAMRPLLTMPETGWWAGEKKFCAVHFIESVSGQELSGVGNSFRSSTRLH